MAYQKKIIATKPILQKDSECAPACLAMVFDSFKIRVGMDTILNKIPKDIPKWRDWLYVLGTIALENGLTARLVNMSTQTLDPSWQTLPMSTLKKKLSAELRFVKRVIKNKREPYRFYFLEHHPKIEYAELQAAIAFLNAGGRIDIQPITASHIRSALHAGFLVIASLDAAILYRSSRGIPKNDDIRGTTWGHVVVVAGYHGDRFLIVDPADWYRKSQHFWVSSAHLIEGIVRRDQNILMLKQKRP